MATGELACRKGRVIGIIRRTEGFTVAEVELDGERAEAVSLHALTGAPGTGDWVLLNTTAVDLGLGTGGRHFVMALEGHSASLAGPGHVMKVRYTPSQLKVLAVEEEGSPHRRRMEELPDLGGIPVAVGGLHSQVPVAAAAIKAIRPGLRVVYVMTDGGALPAALSEVLARTRAAGIIDAVVTAGHAFGGDLEAVTVPSGIAAAATVLSADVIIVAMGPGVVGTGTPLGSTALEQGPILDAAAALGGKALAIPRVSFADARGRHRGISHHTLTALRLFAVRPAWLPLARPREPDRAAILQEQAAALTARGHRVSWHTDGEAAYLKAKELLDAASITVRTMGRSDREDPDFFFCVAAAAARAAEGAAGRLEGLR